MPVKWTTIFIFYGFRFRISERKFEEYARRGTGGNGRLQTSLSPTATLKAFRNKLRHADPLYEDDAGRVCYDSRHRRWAQPPTMSRSSKLYRISPGFSSAGLKPSLQGESIRGYGAGDNTSGGKISPNVHRRQARAWPPLHRGHATPLVHVSDGTLSPRLTCLILRLVSPSSDFVSTYAMPAGVCGAGSSTPSNNTSHGMGSRLSRTIKSPTSICESGGRRVRAVRFQGRQRRPQTNGGVSGKTMTTMQRSKAFSRSLNWA